MLLIGIALTVITDSYIYKTHKTTFLIVLALVATLLIQNVADSLLAQTPYVVARKIISIYGYLIRPAIIVLFHYFLESKKGSFHRLVFSAVFMRRNLLTDSDLLQQSH